MIRREGINMSLEFKDLINRPYNNIKELREYAEEVGKVDALKRAILNKQKRLYDRYETKEERKRLNEIETEKMIAEGTLERMTEEDEKMLLEDSKKVSKVKNILFGLAKKRALEVWDIETKEHLVTLKTAKEKSEFLEQRKDSKVGFKRDIGKISY